MAADDYVIEEIFTGRPDSRFVSLKLDKPFSDCLKFSKILMV
jgi:hypothetical protein